VRVGPVDFEWADAKAEANLRKHRFSFTDALAIFADPTRITIDTIRAEDGEERRKTIGSIEGSLFTAVFVMRGTTCRLISAWRAKVQGERAYGRAKLDHANPPMLSDEARAAIGALTPEDIERTPRRTRTIHPSPTTNSTACGWPGSFRACAGRAG